MKPAVRALLVALWALASTSVLAADAWSNALKRRGIDPSLVENPIAITPEIRAAAEALSGRGGGTVDELKRIAAMLQTRGNDAASIAHKEYLQFLIKQALEAQRAA